MSEVRLSRPSASMLAQPRYVEQNYHDSSGETSLQVCNPKNGEVVSVDFIVVKNSLHCLLSLSAVRTLNFITVNDNNFIANIATDAVLGNLGTVTLHINPNIVPRASPCRRVPLALEGKLKTTLD